MESKTMKLEPARHWRYNEKRRKYLGKTGRLMNWSVVYVGPEGLENRTPYVVGLVTVGRETVMAQIGEVEPGILKKGMKLWGQLRRLFDVPADQLIVYGVKFVPVRKT
jgi:uncharacterized OB-fold protein